MTSEDMRGHSCFMPVGIGLVALLVLLGFQVNQLIVDRQALSELAQRQEKPLTEAKAVRAQLDAIAAGVRRLSEDGNLHAKKVVAALAKQGISIKDPAASP